MSPHILHTQVSHSGEVSLASPGQWAKNVELESSSSSHHNNSTRPHYKNKNTCENKNTDCQIGDLKI